MKKKKLTQGSYTIEMAMITGVVLFVIISLLVGSRIIYNRAKAIAHQYEIAITERQQELVGLWGNLDEEIKSIEMDKIKPSEYLRKAQFIKEM